jgi:HEPN domain-containing protein/predicted nucleotidyltransferase
MPPLRFIAGRRFPYTSVVRDNALQVVVDRLVRAYDPDRIILFGSQATGKADADSDVDLLVVKDTDARPIDRRVEAHALVADLGVPVDLVVYTGAELRALYLLGSPLVEDALESGRLIYMRKATAAWLDEARDEYGTATLLMEHGRLRGALLHAQQASEKAMKAVLLERGTRPPRTHSLVDLVTALRSAGVEFDVPMDDAVFLTNVYRGRYPSDEGLLPRGEPTAEDAQRALVVAHAVLGQARRAIEEGEGTAD